MPKLGPGTLKIGATGTEVDASCLVNNAKITSEKDKDDDTTKLCGTVKQGTISYTFALEGNVDVDPEDPEGLFLLCASHKGETYPFEFIPNTAAGVKATGSLILDPLEFGADNYGDDMTSDFTFDLVGEPNYGTVVPADDAAAGGVTTEDAPLSGDLAGV